MRKTEDAEREAVNPDADAVQSVETVMADGELTPPKKLKALMRMGEGSVATGRRTGYGRVADAADLGLAGPSPYPVSVQRAIVELYRLHRNELPDPTTVAWSKVPTKGQ